MRLRTFSAPDMQSAMEMVRQALGDEAVIISSATDKAQGQVTVTAALEDERLQPAVIRQEARKIPASSLMPRASRSTPEEPWLDELASLLRYHSVPETLAGRLVYKARHLDLASIMALGKLSPGTPPDLLLEKALARLLGACFTFAPLEFRTPAQRIMLCGPPGIGKTLAVAKLASALVMEGIRPLVITCDTRRAGGVEQLAAFTDILELPLHVVSRPAELSGILTHAPRGAPALIDTAGCNPYDRKDIDELTALIGAGGFEPVLVLPLGLDPHEAVDTVRAYSFPAIKRLLATRADTARRYGCLLAAAESRGLALSSLSDSSRVVGGLKPIDANLLAQCLLKQREIP